MARAVVVDVLSLLDLRRERAATPGARYEPGERVLVLCLTLAIGGSEHVLNSREQISRDDRLVESLMQLL